MISFNINKILVPLDDSKTSQKGLEIAIGIARQCKATITGIYVMYAPSRSEFGKHGLFPKGAKEEIEKMMNSAKTKAAKNGIVFHQKIMYGDVGYHIVKFAQDKKNGIDIIVIGSRGKGAARELIFGGTSHHVLHASKIPILIVK